MSPYIHFTDEQKEQARRVDLAELLRSQGERLKRSGKEYEWKDGSQKVTIRGNLWYHQYERVGGDAVDFVRRFYNKSYPEAVEYLLGGSGGALILSEPIEKERKPFELPPKNDTMRRVYGYLLNKRGLDKSVVDAFVAKGMIYESADYHNAVFVGFDNRGNPRHAHKRGTAGNSSFRGNIDSSLPEFSFHWNGNSGELYLFEAPIDMISFISMNKDGWQRHSYAASCGVSSIVMHQMLKDNPGIQTVYLCHDNDEGGEKAVNRIAAELEEKGIACGRLRPMLKDWNDDRLAAGGNTPHKELCAECSVSDQQEGNNLCPALQL